GTDALDALEQLRIDSLLLCDDTRGEMRFRMLETVRQFASTLLTGDALLEAQLRHAAFIRAFVEHAATHLKGPAQAEWIDRIESDQDNIRAAFAALRVDPEGAENSLVMLK